MNLYAHFNRLLSVLFQYTTEEIYLQQVWLEATQKMNQELCNSSR